MRMEKVGAEVDVGIYNHWNLVEHDWGRCLRRITQLVTGLVCAVALRLLCLPEGGLE